MCGIAGRFNYLSGAPVDPHIVRGMCDLIAHRGPDGEGVWTDGAVGLGHRRLAIVDLSPAGRQPMSARGGALQITFNGEIYNYVRLRYELTRCGHHFRTRTDTEVILAAYEEWGVAMRPSPARHVRIRPVGRGQAHFAPRPRPRRQEAPPLPGSIATGSPSPRNPRRSSPIRRSSLDPNLQAISSYLDYQYVPGPQSAFEGVHKLPAAHYAVVRDGRLTLERYWKLSYAAKQRISEEDACGELLARLARHGSTAARRRRAARCVPERRHRFECRRGGHGHRKRRGGQDLLHRVRGRRIQRASVRPPRRRALRHRSSRVRRPPERDGDLPASRLALQRAIRRCLGDSDLLPLAAGAAQRDRRAERRRGR